MRQILEYIFSFLVFGFGLSMVLSAAGYAIGVLLSLINKVIMKGV